MALDAPTLAKYQEITTSGTSFVTSSWTPTASRLYLCWVAYNIASGTVSAPTSVTGNGLTWSKVLDSEVMDASTRMGSLWAAYGSGSAGATTITMGATHASAIVAIYEQSDVTGVDAVLQSSTAKSENQQTLVLSLSPFGASGNTCMAFFNIKNASSGGATGVDPSSGMTELTEDRIDANRAVYVEYQLSENTAPGMTLTGDSDGNYTLHRMTGVAIEIGAAATLVARVEIILDIDLADLEEEEPTPPVIVDVPGSISSGPSDVQASTARPRIERSRDAAAIMAATERRANEAIAHTNALFGFEPYLDEDPVNPPDGARWIRSTTGERCWVAGGVIQVTAPSTPIQEENG